MLLLGNDIVDLNEAGIAGKSGDARFVKRVFSDDEQTAILSSPNPNLTLWMMWAAKETAYKIISKLIGPPVFSHKKFKTTFLESPSAAMPEIEVIYSRWRFKIEIKVNKSYIHAVGTELTTGEFSNYFRCEKVHRVTKSELKSWGNASRRTDDFTKEECLSIHHAASALVRHHCKQAIAETLKISPSRLQIIRPLKDRKSQPPFLLLDNRPTEIDISLSHHGAWVGWCFSVKR